MRNEIKTILIGNILKGTAYYNILYYAMEDELPLVEFFNAKVGKITEMNASSLIKTYSNSHLLANFSLEAIQIFNLALGTPREEGIKAADLAYDLIVKADKLANLSARTLKEASAIKDSLPHELKSEAKYEISYLIEAMSKTSIEIADLILKSNKSADPAITYYLSALFAGHLPGKSIKIANGTANRYVCNPWGIALSRTGSGKTGIINLFKSAIQEAKDALSYGSDYSSIRWQVVGSTTMSGMIDLMKCKQPTKEELSSFKDNYSAEGLFYAKQKCSAAFKSGIIIINDEFQDLLVSILKTGVSSQAGILKTYAEYVVEEVHYTKQDGGRRTYHAALGCIAAGQPELMQSMKDDASQDGGLLGRFAIFNKEKFKEVLPNIDVQQMNTFELANHLKDRCVRTWKLLKELTKEEAEVWISIEENVEFEKTINSVCEDWILNHPHVTMRSDLFKSKAITWALKMSVAHEYQDIIDSCVKPDCQFIGGHTICNSLLNYRRFYNFMYFGLSCFHSFFHENENSHIKNIHSKIFEYIKKEGRVTPRQVVQHVTLRDERNIAYKTVQVREFLSDLVNKGSLNSIAGVRKDTTFYELA